MSGYGGYGDGGSYQGGGGGYQQQQYGGSGGYSGGGGGYNGSSYGGGGGGYGGGSSGYGGGSSGGYSGSSGGYGGYDEGEMQIQVPAMFVGRIIGKGGSKIRELQETSGAHINLEKENRGTTNTVTLKGSQDAMGHAKHLIEELCVDRGSGGGGGRGFGGGGGGGGSFGPSIDLEVPSSMVGKIIGRGGSKIRELQDNTGARIKIDKQRDDPQRNVSYVEFTGDSACTANAKQLVEALCAETNQY